ncbi:hypothetical protein Dda_6117 [Drechslerella dactyloides]|uniref:Uncharacterized protein n=1 Tax=Drechslerella dactyloides TaxID=74499 RepID=A0AAD6IWH1_DREDA|nr:hypothetical protein Dda_6117 [Drechslerella dactyloides]
MPAASLNLRAKELKEAHDDVSRQAAAPKIREPAASQADKFIQYCKDYFSHIDPAGMKRKITSNRQTYTLLHSKNALALWATYKMDVEFSTRYPS